MKLNRIAYQALTLAAALTISGWAAHGETLRLLTWGGYAPDEVISMFEAKYPDIKVEVTLSNNEEIIAKLRATGGSGFDLAQPGFNRVSAAQDEYDIYKPLDLSKINTSAMDPILLERVVRDTTIKGNVYAVPHLWGTSGLMADVTKAKDIRDWDDLCNPSYKGKTSLQMGRTILMGIGFAMGKDPYAAFSNLEEYKNILDEVSQKLIECKENVKAYWKGGDDLANLMRSGEVILAQTWDSTAYKLFEENPNIHYIAPASGAFGWIDSFSLPKRGKADDAAYKWINFVTEPEVATLLAKSSGSIPAVEGGINLMPKSLREAISIAFDEKAIANIRWAVPVAPGIEDLDGIALDRIRSATGK